MLLACAFILLRDTLHGYDLTLGSSAFQHRLRTSDGEGISQASSTSLRPLRHLALGSEQLLGSQPLRCDTDSLYSVSQANTPLYKSSYVPHHTSSMGHPPIF